MEKNTNDNTIVIAHIVGKWLGGGVESVVMNYYRHIDRNKIQFHFICDSDSTDIPYEEIEKLGGKVILVPPYQNLHKYNKELTKVFNENQYKIVHSNINTLSVFPLRIAKKCGIPVRIAHSHSTTNKKEWKKNMIKNILRPFSKLYATDYFACSEHAGRWLFGNRTYDEGKVYILNNAIEVEKFAYNEKIRKQKRDELGIKDDTLVVGHVGRFVPQKNHEFLIDIFNEVHKENENTMLLLIGQGPLEEKTREKVSSLGLQDSAQFLGQRDDTNELYQAMDVFCLPSLYEGLGIVLIEAQCSVLPCIVSSEVPKEAKICEKMEFVELQESIEQWKSIIMTYLNHINRQKDVSKIDKSNYNIEIEGKKLEQKYKTLLNECNENKSNL